MTDEFKRDRSTGSARAGRGSPRIPIEPPAEPLRKGIQVVVPAYDEARSIARVVRELRGTYPNVVVVDDGSSDETGERARRAGATVLRHVLNRGQGAALQSGIEYALAQGAEIVVTFDADGQHDVRDIARLVRPILEGEVDVVLGSRFLEDGAEVPRLRRLLLAAGIVFTRLTTGARLSDTHNGLRAFSRRAAARLQIRLDGMAHASEVIDCVHRSGLPYCEAPVRIRYTEYSQAKGQRASGAFRIVLDYLMDRFTR